MKKISILFSLIMFALVSCERGLEEISLIELGVERNEVYFGPEGGSYSMKIYADGEFTAKVTEGSDWLSFPEGYIFTGTGDCDAVLQYGANKSLKRTAVICLERGHKTTMVTLTQAGLFDVGLEFKGHNILCESRGGENSAKLLTVLSFDELNIDIEYAGSSFDWIYDVRKTNNFLSFKTTDNPEVIRYADIKVSSKADPSLSDILKVSQKGTEEMSVLSFADVKGMLDAEGSILIDKDYILDGIVINDNLQGNGAPNSNSSGTVQDLSLSGRTLYVQNNPDGESGIKVVLDKIEQNSTRRYDRIRLYLSGLVLSRSDNPVRYTISNATDRNILSTSAGSAYDIVPKVRTISSLNDSDIYTYVTLTDCEIPFRKGPFVPIDLRHRDVINRYPMPIRDKEGSSIHLMTNLGASWERDGKPMPQGSGNISGVLVYETCDNFAWDFAKAEEKRSQGVDMDYINDIGHISRYQIRPITRAEIALSEDFNDGFSEFLAEYRYMNSKHEEIIINTSGNVIRPTYPASQDPLNDTGLNGKLQVVGPATGIGEWRDWTHLGPLENGIITDKNNGNGVFDANGKTCHWMVYSLVPTTGLIYMDNGSAWYASGWSTSKYWMATFTTSELTLSNSPVSIQFGAENGQGEGVGAPRYWAVEYSIDGGDWIRSAEYTVPDFSILYKKRVWQCPGFKMMTFNLPDDVIGKEEVRVRLIPVSSKAGTLDSYDGGVIGSSAQSALNYFAIRYNK